MSSMLNRYLQGEYVQVWKDLSALGGNVHQLPVYEDALAVAHETMRRVRQNIEVLIPRLQTCGYEFGYAWMPALSPSDRSWIAEQPSIFRPPDDEIAERIERFEQQGGLLPLSLRAFYLEVGEVNFVGRHARWEELFQSYTVRGLEPANLDPLVVFGFAEEIIEDYLLWQQSGHDGTEDYPLAVSGDALLKYNGSGAGAYEMTVPDLSADGLLLNEWHQTTFVNYLRHCLAYGGLPGLERIQHAVPEELAYLRKDLLLF